MKKIKLLLLTLPIFLTGCVMNNGICYQHSDADFDGICDVCGTEVPLDHEHIDVSGDGKCDICGIVIPSPTPGPVQPCSTHVDQDLDGKCDVCNADLSAPAHTHIDANNDHACDICGAKMEECLNHIDNNNDGYCDYCGVQMDLPEKDVTVYLVLSSVGLYNGATGASYSDLFIENAIKYEAKSGSKLPGAEAVTHLYKCATFESWYAYEGSGAPTVYTTVPYQDNKILYANFVSNGETPVPPTPDPSPEPTEKATFTLLTGFDGGNWSEANAQILMYCWKSDGSHQFYTMTRVDDTKYITEVPDDYYSSCLFLRLSPDDKFNSATWSPLWNQSSDLAFESGMHTAQITGWENASGAKSGVVWVA